MVYQYPEGTGVKFTQLLELTGLNKPTFIGADLEPSSSLLVWVTKKQKTFRLQYFNITELPGDAFDKNVINDPERIGKIIAQSAKKVISNSTYSILPASAKLVTTHTIKVPTKSDEKKQEALIYAEVEKLFPNIINELYLDYTITEKCSPESKLQEVFVVAAHKNAIQNRLETMNFARIPTRILDVDYFAIQRGFELLKKDLLPEVIKENVAILDINTSRLLLTVFNNEELIHFKHHDYFIKDFSRLIRYYVNNIEPNREALENLKLGDGIYFKNIYAK
jgi:type IV pilus assembly protein PilM